MEMKIPSGTGTTHMLLYCQFIKNDINLRYHRLQHPLFGDTMFSVTKSKCGNTCDDMFGTYFGWASDFLMKIKFSLIKLFHLYFNMMEY